MRYNGPFEIARQVGKDMYTLKSHGKLIKSTFHANDFKRCSENFPEKQEDNKTAGEEKPIKRKPVRPKKTAPKVSEEVESAVTNSLETQTSAQEDHQKTGGSKTAPKTSAPLPRRNRRRE